MEKFSTLVAEARPRVGKGSARATRRAGKVPAVIYGAGKEPLPIAIEKRALDVELAKGRFMSRLFQVEVDGQVERVLPRDVQYHVVTDQPEHVDFLRLSLDATVHVMVPVHFLNQDQSPGLKRGGVLNVVRYDVELNCRADAIPQFLEADLSGFEIGDSLHISHIKLPEGTTPVIADRDFTVATVAAPTVSLAATEEAAGGTPAAS